MIKNTILKMYVKLQNLSGRKKGQAMTEYIVILAVILIVVIGTLAAIGTRLNGVAQKILSALPS